MEDKFCERVVIWRINLVNEGLYGESTRTNVELYQLPPGLTAHSNAIANAFTISGRHLNAHSHA